MHATLSSLLISILPVHSPAFFPNLSQVFPVLAVANTDSCVGQQNKIGHRAECRFLRLVLVEYKQAPKHVLLFFWFCVPILWIEFEVWPDKKKKRKKIRRETCGIMTCGMNNLEID